MEKKYREFIQTIYSYYAEHKRSMPWRTDTLPYSIFLSEVMLQQTQVSRVLVKYQLFKKRFPNFRSLAEAQTPALLSAWQGMGYNRRALYLRSAAWIIQSTYKGRLPADVIKLDELPGIGYATACSIAAFAFNKPVVFIETNIRRVYIHHFFPDDEDVADKDIVPHLEKTIDLNNPREWYWALMDYGAYLSTQIDNPNRKSKHYIKQKKFEGSGRQVRGAILKLLLTRPYRKEELEKIYMDDKRFATALDQLIEEGFIILYRGVFKIK